MRTFLRNLRRASPRSILAGAILGVLNVVLGAASLTGLAWGFGAAGLPAHAFQIAMSALLVAVGGIAVGIALVDAKHLRAPEEAA